LKTYFYRILQNNSLFRKLIYTGGKLRAKDLLHKIEKHINIQNKIIDVGSGTCNIPELLRERNFNIMPVDIIDLSFVDDIKPVIIDGGRIPFEDNHFDVSLILTVLHHIKNPREMIEEAMRVSKKVIIIEDIFGNWFEKYATFFFDSVANLEFIGHPHSNKSDKQWRELFTELGLKVISAEYMRAYWVFRHGVYCLEKDL
jgi:hypothetical protein